MSKRYILSPCGTSLLTNRADRDERVVVFKHANKKNKEEIEKEDREKLESLIKKVSNSLANADNTEAKRMSAELNGIIEIYDGEISGHGGDFHRLLSTDTWLGEETAKLVEAWLTRKGLTADYRRQRDLQTADISAFQLSLSELVKELSKEIPAYSTKGYEVIFNLTGGFKSVQGFLQSIANFYADETVYIFETSSRLLRIPKLPVRMDTESILRKKISVFRQLALGMHLLLRLLYLL